MYNKNRVFAASCMAILIFGIVMTFLGTILPSVINRYNMSDSLAGLLISLLSIGMLVGTLIFGPIVDRQGYKSMLVLSVGLICAALVAISWIDALWILGVSIFAIGFGGGVLNGGSNALVADISSEGKSSNLSFLGIFFGLGAFGVPFLRGMMPETLAYRIPLSILAILTLFPMLFFLLITFPRPKQEQGFPLHQGFALCKNAALPLLGLILLLESGVEFTINNWAPKFLMNMLKLPENKATLYFSFHLLGIMFSRLFLGVYLKNHHPAKTLRIFFAISVVSSLLILFSNSLWLTVIGLIAVGFGIAAVYPILLAFVSEHFPALSGTAISMAMVMGLFGGALLPYLTGAISTQSTLRSGFILIPVSIVLQFVIFSIYRGHTQKSVER